MVGNFFANMFVHFEVLCPQEGESNYDPESGIPPYIIPGSPYEEHWKKSNPNGWDMVRAFVEFCAVKMWVDEVFVCGVFTRIF
jgi:hypothetical protein